MAERERAVWLSSSLSIVDVLRKHSLPILVKLNEDVKLNESFSLSGETALTIHGKDQLETAFGQDESGRAFTVPLGCKHKVMLRPVNSDRVFQSIQDICDASFLPNCIQNQSPFDVYGIEFPKNTLFHVRGKENSDISLGISVESKGPHPVKGMLPPAVVGNFVEVLKEYDQNKVFLLEELKNRSAPFVVVFEQLDQNLPPHLLPNGMFRVDCIQKQDVVYATAQISNLEYLVALPYDEVLTVKIGQVVENDLLYLSFREPKLELIDLLKAKWLCNNMCTQGLVQFMLCSLVQCCSSEETYSPSTSNLYEEAFTTNNVTSKGGSEADVRGDESGEGCKINKQSKARPPPPRRVSSLKKIEDAKGKGEGRFSRSKSLYSVGEKGSREFGMQAPKATVSADILGSVSAEESSFDHGAGEHVGQCEEGNEELKSTQHTDTFLERRFDGKSCGLFDKSTEIQESERFQFSEANTSEIESVPPIPPKGSSLRSNLVKESGEMPPLNTRSMTERPPIPSKRVNLTKGTVKESLPPVSESAKDLNEQNQKKAPIPAKRKTLQKKETTVPSSSRIQATDLYAKVNKTGKKAVPASPVIKPRMKAGRPSTVPHSRTKNDWNTNPELVLDEANTVLTGKQLVGVVDPRKRPTSRTDQDVQKENECALVEASNAAKEPTQVEGDSVPEDVVNILNKLKLGSYKKQMRYLQVDVSLLQDLSDDDLVQDVGMRRFEAKKLLAYVKEGWRPDNGDVFEENSFKCNEDIKNWTCGQVCLALKKEIKMTEFANFCTEQQVNGKLLVIILEKEILDSIGKDYNCQISNIQKVKLRKFFVDGWKPNS